MTETPTAYSSLWGPGSTRRKVLVVLGALALLFLLAHTVTTFVTGRRLSATVERLESKWGDLSLATLVPPKVSRANNRAPVIRAATDLTVLEREERRVVADYASFREAGLSADETALLSRVLETNALAFELLEAAARRPESDWQIPYRDGVQAAIPPLLDYINLSRLNAARVLRHLEAGDTDAAVAAVEHGLAMTDSFTREPVLIVQLVRISCERLNLGALREVVARADLDAGTLARLQRSVERIAGSEPIRLGSMGEMKAIYKLLRDIESGNSDPSESWVLRFVAPSWLLRPVMRSDARFYLDHMDAMLDYQASPNHLRGDPPRAEPSFYHVVSHGSLPNLENAILRGDLHEARAALARTALALKRFHLDHGAYPEDLRALVPAYVDEISIDPFTGDPPSYGLVAGGFVLHSDGDAVVLPALRNMNHVLHWEIPG